MFRHGRITVVDSTGRCDRCGYIGMVDSETGKLFWS
jgi:hypothetical protein